MPVRLGEEVQEVSRLSFEQTIVVRCDAYEALMAWAARVAANPPSMMLFPRGANPTAKWEGYAS